MTGPAHAARCTLCGAAATYIRLCGPVGAFMWEVGAVLCQTCRVDLSRSITGAIDRGLARALVRAAVRPPDDNREGAPHD